MVTKNTTEQEKLKVNASLEDPLFITTAIRVHRLFISHISGPKLPMLDYLAELLDCLRLMLFRCLLLLNCLRKHT